MCGRSRFKPYRAEFCSSIYWRNRSHRGSGVKIFTFVDTFTLFLCYFYVVVRPASEQENLCSDRLPKECKMCFLLIPSLIPQKRIKRNACSLLNTSNNVVTKQFILVLWIKAFLVFLVKRWGHRFVSNENKTKHNKNHNETSRVIW